MTPADAINRFYDGESVEDIATRGYDDFWLSSVATERVKQIEMLLRGYMIGLRSATGGDEVES